MAAKKKPDEAAVAAPETENTAPETQDTPETENAPESALDGVEGDLAAVIADNGLNLREGPGRGYRAAQVLPTGAAAKVLALPYGTKVPGWALVHTGDRTGWVDIRFIQALEA